MTPRQAFEALLGSLMHVEEPELKAQHRLTGHAKPKVAGLDDPRMHGSHGHLEHAFTGDRPERVKITRHARTTASPGKSLRRAHSPPANRHGGRPASGSDGLRGEAEDVHDLTFEPVRHRYFAAIEGNDGSLGSTGATTWRKDRRFGNDHTWCTKKRPLGLARRSRRATGAVRSDGR